MKPLMVNCSLCGEKNVPVEEPPTKEVFCEICTIYITNNTIPHGISDQCPEGYLQSVRDYANTIGRRAQFERQLKYMGQWGDRLLLFKDFAPQSFYFESQVRRSGELVRWMNGGLIFHSPHDSYGNGEAPTFSVCLDNKEVGWRIHT